MQGVTGMHTGLAPTKTPVCHLWYRWGRSSTYLLFFLVQWHGAKPSTPLWHFQIYPTSIIWFNCTLWIQFPTYHFPWWLRHGAMDPFEEPMWENEDERNSEFTHFNLVIRLRKVKQSALPFLTIFVTSRRSCRFCAALDNVKSAQVKLLRTATNLPFGIESALCSMTSWQLRLQACPLPAGMVHFGFWWGWTYCAPHSWEIQ